MMPAGRESAPPDKTDRPIGQKGWWRMATTTQRRRTQRQRREGNTVPQPTKAPEQPTQPTESAEQRAQREAEERWLEIVKQATADDSSAAKQIKRAMLLEKQVSELRKKVNDNRDYLRLMDRNEELTEAQAEFVDTFYPEKERGERRSAEEVEATRRAREAARRDGTGS